MTRTPRTPRTLLLAAALAVAGCGGGGAAGTATPPGSTSSARPATAARLEIVEPKQGAVLTGSTVHVVVAVQGARIVQVTSAKVRPDEGHVHLFLDGALVYMNYTLEQDLPVHPGTFQLRAEFVASDHFPFNPRATTSTVVFTVH